MPRHLSRSVLTLVLLLSACDLGPDYRRPAVEVPEQFRATPVSGAEVWPSEGWWQGFRSEELNELIEQARTQNFDLQQRSPAFARPMPRSASPVRRCFRH